MGGVHLPLSIEKLKVSLGEGPTNSVSSLRSGTEVGVVV